MEQRHFRGAISHHVPRNAVKTRPLKDDVEKRGKH